MREPHAWDHRQPAIEPPTILGNTSLFGLPLSRIGLGMAGALVGFAIVLWIAANWQSIDKFQKFTIVAAVIFFAALASVSVPRVRAAATLLGVLALGGLLALYGQVYQVSSDTYVLFAVWSAVALPWTGAARSDAAWSLWVLIALTAISLWASAMHPSPNAIYFAIA